MSRRPEPDAAEAILYTRPGCSLCFALHRAAARAARRAALPLRAVDVSRDPDLLARLGDEVPVLVLPGGHVLQGRPSARDVEDAFRNATRDVHGRPAAGAIAAGSRAALRWLRRIGTSLGRGAEAKR